MLAVLASTLLMGETATGQVGVADYREPILVRNGQSHFATIRDLAFTSDGKQLLSAGFDKVIHAWDPSNPSPRPIRTIRPPIFRGDRGQIAAMALSPVEKQGQWLLAVGGTSPGIEQGTIVLMRYPGKDPLNANGSGEILGYLQAHEPKITHLAFDAQGRRLVSADVTGSIKVWDLGVDVDQVDLSNLKPKTTFENKEEILGMVLSKDDRWVVTGDRIGRIRRWNLANGLQEATLLHDFQPTYVRSLAGNRNQSWIVAATNEHAATNTSSQLWQIQLDDPPTSKGLASLPGSVRAIDLSADGRRIAVSLQKLPAPNPASHPSIDECDVKIYDLENGRLTLFPTVKEAHYPVEAVRFAPDGSLAFGGGEKQEVSVRSSLDYAKVIMEAPGPGSVIWDIGFVEGTERAIAFSRNHQNYGGRAAVGEYEGFNLTLRRFEHYPPAKVFRSEDRLKPAITLTVLDQYRFQVSWPGAAPTVIALDRIKDGRWYSYVLFQPLAGGIPLLAVGTDFGISVFSTKDSQKTRFLFGHEDRVTALGVSPDNKWLVSGSADQSIRLWEIKDFERTAPFGASARSVADGNFEVTAVTPRSDAEERGLRVGDIIKDTGLEEGSRVVRVPRADFFARVEEFPADRRIQLAGTHADGTDLALQTRKRQSPTVSLFPDQTPFQDFVLWEPKGHYATSIKGDDRYLGWHQNKMKVGKEKSILFPDTEKTAFSSIAAFKQRFENPGIIDGLIKGVVILPPPPPLVPEVVKELVVTGPPVIKEQAGGAVLIVLPAEGDNSKRPRVEVFADARPLRVDDVDPQVKWEKIANGWQGTITKATLEPFAPNATVWVRKFDSPADPARQDVSIDVPPPLERRLVVFGCGYGTEKLTGVAGHEIRFAKQDVADLTDAFLEHAVTPKGQLTFPTNLRSRCEPIDPSTNGLRKVLDDLKEKPFREGDMLVAILEARTFFPSDRDGQIVLKAVPANDQPVTTREFQERLSEVARTGCRVFLFLDDVHEWAINPETQRDVRDRRNRWIRQLLDDGVSCFMASQQEPSWPRSDERPPQGMKHRLFAQSILDLSVDRRPKTFTFLQFASEVRSNAERRKDKDQLDSMIIHRLSDKVDSHERFFNSRP